MNKILAIFLLIILCLCSCFGCSCDNQDSLIVYKNFYDSNVTTFNYMITNEYHDVTQIANLIDGLVENDKYGNIVPSIASSWNSEFINNKQVWTFHLKDNVYWSDHMGNKHSLVTAHDFVTTIKYILNYESKSNNYYLPATLLNNGLSLLNSL